MNYAESILENLKRGYAVAVVVGKETFNVTAVDVPGYTVMVATGRRVSLDRVSSIETKIRPGKRRVTHTDGSKDGRYGVAQEGTGKGVEFVARFMGERIGAAATESAAWTLAIEHNDNRL